MKAVIYKYIMVCIGFLVCFKTQAQVYEIEKGNIQFYSDAPQELIKAYSENISGIVDFTKNIFFVKVGISSFNGFNSPLQREHFNENYMESTMFPVASFSGKLIEEVNPEKDKKTTVRAKGDLLIHGITQERIIPALIRTKGKEVLLEADFIILLSDHDIKIPRVVSSKLSQKIHVSVFAKLTKRK